MNKYFIRDSINREYILYSADDVDKLLDEILLAYENGDGAIVSIKQIIEGWRNE